LFISHDLITERIITDQILFIQANGNYVNIFTDGNKHIVRMTMHEIEAKLSVNKFIRVHKSYIVAKNKIDRLIGNTMKIRSAEIPIGATYKLNLLKSLQNG
ncbi:MAG: LytTR family transcriptional regulator, partial [Bacteroidetes bacterium]|nr:LytTR family transcriptional regulator [Bacteroidota bacterium]